MNRLPGRGRGSSACASTPSTDRDEARPSIVLDLALVIPSDEALFATEVLFIFVHFCSAHLRPESFPLDGVVFTGPQPVEDYKAEWPLEYARRVREGTLDEVLVERRIAWWIQLADAVRGLFAAVAGQSAVLMTAFIIWKVSD